MNDIKKYWLVGHTFGKEGSQLERFIKNEIWETKHVDGIVSDQNLKKTVKDIGIGDILILKSTATKGPKHNQPFLRVKGIGRILGPVKSYRIGNSEYCQYPVKYVNIQDKDFDGATYGSYRKMLHLLDDKIDSIRKYADKCLNESNNSEGNMMENAVRMMMDSHEGQTDKAGQPYFLHPMRVALNCETPLQKTVAFLHDVIEDASVTSHNLKCYGFSDEVVEAVLSLTRKPHEDYETFIGRCALNPLGRYVKIRDIEDNLNVCRLAELDYAATLRINKYLKALRFLKSLE